MDPATSVGRARKYAPGWHFLQVPGPSNVPERILHAVGRSTIDHRSGQFAELYAAVLSGLKRLAQTTGDAVIYPSSGTGAWEAALVNTLSPGDAVLAFETGHFASAWRDLAERLGLSVSWIESDWRHPVSSEEIYDRLSKDVANAIRAVLIVHNETSTGATSDVQAVRAAIDEAGHSALLLVDVISSLGSMAYHHDAWGVDVTIGCSQKGLMLPPGLGFNLMSRKALRAAERAGSRRSYWDWRQMTEAASSGFAPYTPSTNLLFGLREALSMLEEEGLDAVFARHARLAEATRRCVEAWGLEFICLDATARSNSLTGVLLPLGFDSDVIRRNILQRYNLSLGGGLGRLKGRCFRIGHLGDLNDLMLTGTLCGIEMGLSVNDVPIEQGGVDAAMRYLEETESELPVAVDVNS